MARKLPYGVATAMEGAIGGLNSAIKVRESLALAYWDAVVGPQAAAATEPEAVRDGVLFVRTKSSVWSHELSFLQAHIKSELNRRIGKPVIQSIVFRARGVRRKPTESPARSHPTESELEAIELSVQEEAELQREIVGLRTILSEPIRAATARRLVRERRLRHWRLDHGWRACARCGSVHDIEGDLCPICRIDG